jgi:hypothetical protein
MVVLEEVGRRKTEEEERQRRTDGMYCIPMRAVTVMMGNAEAEEEGSNGGHCFEAREKGMPARWVAFV